MFERTTDSEERGQIGIGTLIVFIALVLVAAIAAGVLINTAGILQTQAQQTGEQSRDQVSDRLEPIQTTGNVTDSDEIDTIDFVLQKSPGSNTINVSSAVLSFTGPNGTERFNLTNDDVFSADAFQDQDGSIGSVSSGDLTLNDIADRLILTLNLTNAAQSDPLTQGQEAEVRITGQSGATSLIQITVPESLAGESSVSL